MNKVALGQFVFSRTVGFVVNKVALGQYICFLSSCGICGEQSGTGTVYLFALVMWDLW